MPNRSKILAVALLAAVFAAGAVSGLAIQAWADGRPAPRGPRGPDRTIHFLSGELDLTPAQQDSVRAVFVRYKGAMDNVWRDVRPRFDSVRALVRADVMTHLTAAQQARYRELIAQKDEERARHGDSGRAQTK
jgi:Spy/CpxP family protein refolding chaperone